MKNGFSLFDKLSFKPKEKTSDKKIKFKVDGKPKQIPQISGFMLRKDFLIKNLMEKQKSHSTINIFKDREATTIDPEPESKEKNLHNIISIRNLPNFKTDRSAKISKKSSHLLKNISRFDKALLGENIHFPLSKESRITTKLNINSPKPNKNYTKIKFPKLTLKPKSMCIHDMKVTGSFNSFVDTNFEDFKRTIYKESRESINPTNLKYSKYSNFSHYNTNSQNFKNENIFNNNNFPFSKENSGMSHITTFSPRKLKLNEKFNSNAKEVRTEILDHPIEYANLLSSPNMNTKESSSQTSVPTKPKFLVSTLENLNPDKKRLQLKLKNKIIKNLLEIEKNNQNTKNE